jgi:hypothetical protein
VQTAHDKPGSSRWKWREFFALLLLPFPWR